MFDIKKHVCQRLDVNMDSFDTKNRKREIVQARQFTMKFSKMFTKNSLATIGAFCGNKDHATSIHGIKTVDNLCSTDKEYKNIFEELENEFKENYVTASV